MQLTDATFTNFIICIDIQHRFCCHQKWWRSFEVNEHNSHTRNDQVWREYFIFNDHIVFSGLNVLVRYILLSILCSYNCLKENNWEIHLLQKFVMQ